MELVGFYKKKYPNSDHQSLKDFGDLVLNQFKNFFISYAKAFNKRYNRRGSLFLNNFKRKRVTKSAYFFQLIRYIHMNPVHHGFSDNLEEWPHNSYQVLMSNQETFLKRKQVLSRFGGKNQFEQFHQPLATDL